MLDLLGDAESENESENDGSTDAALRAAVHVAPPVPSDPREQMVALVSGQSAEGSFAVSSLLLALAGGGSDLAGSVPPELAGAGDAAEGVWVTALALAVLRSKCSGLAAEWAAVARKAARWARRTLRAAGVDADAAWEAAERAAATKVSA